MAATQTSAQEASSATSVARYSDTPRVNSGRRAASDDEILGIDQETGNTSAYPQPSVNPPPTPRRVELRDSKGPETEPADAVPENLRAALDANPELRQAWKDARTYRETFATPEEARAATSLVADLDHMDALFFSQRPEDHAALARLVADLDPSAFASLMKAMNQLASATERHGEAPSSTREVGQVASDGDESSTKSPDEKTKLTRSKGQHDEGISQAQEQFFHATNAAAVQNIVDAIESQVERLLPEGASRSARNRVIGEIYRELDNTLRSNRQLARQMREAFRSGSLDADHQRAIVSLIAGRARQALPGVAKRVLNEWTSTVMAADQGRRARQRAAERRVDIAGSNGGGNEGRRPTTPRDIDYARMSDADILNL